MGTARTARLTRKPRNPRTTQARPRTVEALVDAYLDWARSYYLSPVTRRPTGEADNLHYALEILRQLFPRKRPENLRAEDLCLCQAQLVKSGLSRLVINDRLNRIRRCVKWCAQPPRRWVSSAVLADLMIVAPLKRGRTPAPEREPVRPVDWERVVATISHADLELATAIELQWWTGMRPGELCRMTRQEIQRRDDGVMVYTPREHKTMHYGLDRSIVIGPGGIAVLEPWLKRVPADQSRLWKFNTRDYRQRINRINRRHGIAAWHPNQIRHAFGTRLRSLAGIEASQIAMGHAHMSTTEIYAERDKAKNIDTIRRFC